MVHTKNDDAQKHTSTKKALGGEGVTVDFASTYTAYQNGIPESEFCQCLYGISEQDIGEGSLPVSTRHIRTGYRNDFTEQVTIAGASYTRSATWVWSTKSPEEP